MKYLIFISTISVIISCSNPLDSVYNEPNYNNDIKLIKDANEEDSDRIIDQVKYADEIKPGTTYREILEDFYLRKELLINILELYEQESSKKYFDYNDFVQIENNIKNEGKKFTWSSDNFYSLNSSIKNITDKKIDLGLISFFTNKLLFYDPIKSLPPGEKLSFSNSFYSYNEPKISNLLHLKIGDSIYHPTEAYMDIVEQLHHLISEEMVSDITKYYNQKPYNKKISDIISDIEIDQAFAQKKDLTFEDVLLSYENKKKLDYKTAEKSINTAIKLIEDNKQAILRAKKAKLLEEKRLRILEENKAENRRKKEEFRKLREKDREDFILVLNQCGAEGLSKDIAIRKFDRELKAWDDLWVDGVRLIIREKIQGYNSLKIIFQGSHYDEDKTTLFNISIPCK